MEPSDADKIEAQVRLAYERTNLDFAKMCSKHTTPQAAVEPKKNERKSKSTEMEKRAFQNVGKKSAVGKYKKKFGLVNNINLIEIIK